MQTEYAIWTCCETCGHVHWLRTLGADTRGQEEPVHVTKIESSGGLCVGPKTEPMGPILPGATKRFSAAMSARSCCSTVTPLSVWRIGVHVPRDWSIA